MTSHGVELRLSDEEDAYIIRNLWPLYLHDVSEFDGCRPNRHGIVGQREIGAQLNRNNQY